ncbi:MAG: AbrB/MazE/SpoVT family DNA-binding domain-containing protein [Bifidobacteriaceae bacterium]|nr:AbrB/MazE/SpoVT family DNA-binding domain-containing protein [Bifidobacteriaceae bacterium]
MTATTTAVSTKGQVVIPASARKALGLKPGDVLTVDVRLAERELILRRRETLEEVSARVSVLIRPGTPPLIDTSELYQRRAPRL